MPQLPSTDTFKYVSGLRRSPIHFQINISLKKLYSWLKVAS